MIESALDQTIFVPNIGDKLAIVAQVLNQVEDTKNLEPAIDLLNDLRMAQQTSGLEMAMTLSGLQKMWSRLDLGDEFEDFIMASVGLSKQTVVKYIRIWDTIFENKEIASEDRRALATKPIKGLLLLPAAIREGDLTSQDIQEIVAAHDVATIREVVRKARGQQTSSKNAVVILWTRDGELVAYRHDGERINIGFLSRDLEEDVGKIAIERLVRAAGVVEQ